MSALIDLVASLGPWAWLIAGLLLMVLETIVPGVHFLWFGISAVVIGILVFATGEAISQPWQLVLFAILSVATVYWVRRFANLQHVESAEKDLNQRSAQYVGRVVVVEEDISSGRGRVRVGDTLWAAKGADAPKGTHVRITGADGTVFIVEPA